MPEENFTALLYKFATEDSNGMYYRRSYQINFDKTGKLIYAQIIIETSTERYQAQSKMQTAYDRWETIHETFRSAAPAGLKNSFQTAMFHWSFIKTEAALYNNAYIGIGTSIVASFLIVLGGTLNVLSAFYAALSIGGIMTCVLAMFTLLGWEFGTMESIMSVVVLAFVARFIFLVSFSFLSTDFESRYERATMALKLAGVSIVHSSISTVVSGFFIYACVLLLLDEFGTIVCFTILYSVLYSLFFLPSLLNIIGPSGRCGYVGCLFFCLKCPCAQPAAVDEPPPVTEHSNSADQAQPPNVEEKKGKLAVPEPAAAAAVVVEDKSSGSDKKEESKNEVSNEDKSVAKDASKDASKDEKDSKKSDSESEEKDKKVQKAANRSNDDDPSVD